MDELTTDTDMDTDPADLPEIEDAPMVDPEPDPEDHDDDDRLGVEP